MSQRGFVLSIIFLMLTGAAFAQYRSTSSGRDRFELFGHAGMQTESGEDFESGTVAAYGASVGYYFTEKLEGEFDFDYGSGFYPRHQNYFTEFNVLYHFGDSEVYQPYIVGGLGCLRTQWDDNLPGGEQTDFAGNVGSGIKILLHPHVALRMEYKLSGVSGLLVNRFRAGVSFRF